MGLVLQTSFCGEIGLGTLAQAQRMSRLSSTFRTSRIRESGADNQGVVSLPPWFPISFQKERTLVLLLGIGGEEVSGFC